MPQRARLSTAIFSKTVPGSLSRLGAMQPPCADQRSLVSRPLRWISGLWIVVLSAVVACSGDDDPPLASSPQYAPVPAAAQLPPRPAKGYQTVNLGDGAYMVTDGTYQMMFLVTGAGVIAVDGPPSLAAYILPAIAEVTNQPVTHVVYSHAHNDHIAGVTIYPKTAQIIAHAETAKILRRANDPKRPVPTITFDGETRYTLTVGSQTLYLDYHGNNHQPGELFIYAPKQKILMVIDIVFDRRWAPFKNLAIASDVPGLVKAFDLILGYDFVGVLGGHLAQLADREDVMMQRQYIQDLVAAAAQANQLVDRQEATRDVDPQNVWLQFKAFSDAVTAKCVELMPKDWVTKLGGADVFVSENCFIMSESQRID
jgi:glyoxylase-like metal-dependent hydrolase (beta-lactamase superfamily II)